MKILINLLIPCTIMILLTACPPPDDPIITQLEDCLNECEKPFIAAKLEYSKCDETAFNDFKDALNACGQYDKVDVFQNCLNTALSNFENQRNACNEAWQQAQETYERCKQDCWNKIAGGESTEG